MLSLLLANHHLKQEKAALKAKKKMDKGKDKAKAKAVEPDPDDSEPGANDDDDTEDEKTPERDDQHEPDVESDDDERDDQNSSKQTGVDDNDVSMGSSSHHASTKTASKRKRAEASVSSRQETGLSSSGDTLTFICHVSRHQDPDARDPKSARRSDDGDAAVASPVAHTPDSDSELVSILHVSSPHANAQFPLPGTLFRSSSLRTSTVLSEPPRQSACSPSLPLSPSSSGRRHPPTRPLRTLPRSLTPDPAPDQPPRLHPRSPGSSSRRQPPSRRGLLLPPRQ